MVVCTVCGLESSAKEYREQIEAWQEEVCHALTNDATKSRP